MVLSAQATDASVNRATPELFRIADTPQKLAQLGEAGLEAKIKTIGLYRSKAQEPDRARQTSSSPSMAARCPRPARC